MIELSDHDIERMSAGQKAQRMMERVVPERAIYQDGNSIVVQGKSGYYYRIWNGSQTEIWKEGKRMGYACLQTSIPAPSYDRMTAEYLLIKNDEERYLRTANITTPGRRSMIWPATMVSLLMFDLALLANLVLNLLGH